MWTLKNGSNEHNKRSRLIDLENKLVVNGGEEGGEAIQWWGSGRYKLLDVRQATRRFCTTQEI